ncbi:hypothetical protein L9F63_012160, partial [Diploptera punctata]
VLATTGKSFRHRAHTVYVGVHLPGIKRRSHHRRHKHHHKNGISKDASPGNDEDNDRPRQIVLTRRGRVGSVSYDNEICKHL